MDPRSPSIRGMRPSGLYFRGQLGVVRMEPRAPWVKGGDLPSLGGRSPGVIALHGPVQEAPSAF